MHLEGILLGRYRILHLLGKGGMGEVYLAEDPQVERKVAIKVLQLPINSETDAGLRLFKKELQALAHLNHRHIVPLFDSGQQDYQQTILAYMVMPLYEEGTLAQWWQAKQKIPLPATDVAGMIMQAATALQHAHNHGIIHRDVKPSNFLIRTQDTEIVDTPDLFLSDFGIAKLSTIITTSAQVRGTPSYMAPEHLRGNADVASDQYALAVMAYEFLTGCPLFRGGQIELAYQHIHEPPQPPSQLNSDLPIEVDAVLLRALAKRPAERYPTILDFARELRKIFTHAKSETLTAQTHQPNSLTIKEAQIINEQRATDNSETQAINEFPDLLGVVPKSPSIKFGTKRQRKKVSPIPGFLNSLLLSLLVLVLLLTTSYFLFPSLIRSGEATNNITPTASATISPTPKARQTFPPTSTPTFSDSLTQNTKQFQWEESDDGEGSCSFKNKHYDVKQNKRGDLTTCTAQGIDSANFALQVEVSQIQGLSAGLLFHMQDTFSEFYVFQIDRGGSYQLTVYTDNTRDDARIITRNTSSVIKTTPGASNLLGLRVHNGSFELYINGFYIQSATDRAYTHGYLGLFVDAQYDTPTEAVFENLKLWVE